MPRQMFVDDAMNLETGICAIERLRSRYIVSMEPTAVWYGITHPGLCGLVMVEPAANQKRKANLQDDTSEEQLLLPLEIPPRRIIVDHARRYALKVKYFVKSH